MFIRVLFYGLLAHLLIGWAFFFFAPKPIPREIKPRMSVQIHIEEKPVTQLITRPPGSGSGSNSGARSQTAERPSPPRQTPVPAPRYADLIPKAIHGQISLPQAEGPRQESLIRGHQFKPGSSGVTKQKLLVDASILSGSLDVPLKARRISSGSAAFLRIERVAEGLRIVDLRGDPMLRAVIFENLHEARVAALILQLMDELQENSLPITLQSLTGSADRLQDETDFTWIGRSLVIRKSAPMESKAPAGAITLPDADAKKAIVKDRLEFERFQRSRAYRSAIQNYDLPRP